MLPKYMYASLPEDIARLVYSGNWTAAKKRLKFLLEKELSEDLRARLEWEFERLDRIKNNYTVSEDEAFQKIREVLNVDDSTIIRWREEGILDYLIIEGKRMYFRRFLDNLLFLCNEEPCEKAKTKLYQSPHRQVLKKHVYNIIKMGQEGFVAPQKFRVRVELEVDSTSVIPGDTLRVWLPFPKENHQQTDIKILSVNPKKYFIAPNSAPQRTIYFEYEYEGGELPVFSLEVEYTVYAHYRVLDPKKVRYIDEDNEIYDLYTGEKPPHIIFTHRLVDLAYEIAGDEDNPLLVAKRIYEWITKNMTYTYVPEYATYDSIADYTAQNLRGDCGFHAILFITLARILGIPAKWQSGWYANPSMPGPSPHDWAQFYIEPYGWLFVDGSFGRYWRGKDPLVHKFYFGNIDAFRTVFNEDLWEEFDPPMKAYRLDPVDNQLGEVETERGKVPFRTRLKFI